MLIDILFWDTQNYPLVQFHQMSKTKSIKSTHFKFIDYVLLARIILY